jgi:hypothetical protein
VPEFFTTKMAPETGLSVRCLSVHLNHLAASPARQRLASSTPQQSSSESTSCLFDFRHADVALNFFDEGWPR